MPGDLPPRAPEANGARFEHASYQAGPSSGILCPGYQPADDPLRAVQHFLSRLHEPSIILVALSGGSDSMGLLIALHMTLRASPTRHRLVACTVDHALRPGSAQEAAIVAARCAALGIPHRIARWSHEGVASAVQSRARLARYRLLLETAREVGADLVVTGHTADDQAETIAMRAERNSDDDTPGLAGMADAVLFERCLWIARPFLTVRRDAIRKVLQAFGVGWIDDPSNDDLRFERVRVRRRTRTEPDTPQARQIGRFASGAAIAHLLSHHVVLHEGLVAEIPAAAISMADPDWRRLLVILAAVLGGKVHGMGRETADRLFSTLGSGLPFTSTAGRVVFSLCRKAGSVDSDRLFLHRERRDLATAGVLPGETLVWDGRFLIENRLQAPITVQAAERTAQAAVRTVTAAKGETFSAVPPFADIAKRLVARGVPKGIAAQAAGTAPSLLCPRLPESVESFPKPRVVIAPYDTFLPRFDLMIAESLAERFGREAYPACPVGASALQGA